MSKFKHIQEFEFHASANILYPYLATLSGLEQWFAESATTNSAKVWDIVWDDEHHFAKKIIDQKNKHVKYEFLSEDKKEVEDPNTLEFFVEKNDFTGMNYVKVVDYSEEEDEDELIDLWEQIMQGLHDIVAG